MTWLYEDQIVVLLVGGIVLVVLAAIGSQVSRVMMVLGALVGLAIAGGLALVEHQVVTDVEKVEAVLYGAAAAVEANDLAALEKYVDPEAHVLPRARTRLSQWKIQQVKIGNLHIEVNPLTVPQSATATFLGRAEIADQSGASHLNYVGKIELQFRRTNENWLITGVHDLR